MAEVGNMGLPAKLLAQGVTDMVRISDARMSGTAYGTVVLHVAPEAAAGGPLATVKEGDWIELDCATGRLHLDIPDAELAARMADLQPPQQLLVGGYRQLYIDHVLQADQGCDFDFLVGMRGSEVPSALSLIHVGSLDGSHAPRREGSAGSLDVPQQRTRSVRGCMPTRSVGTI
jgi:L-arabonate dehydrase